MSKLPEQKEKTQRPSILNVLLTRPERDREYMSDLNSHWDQLDKRDVANLLSEQFLGRLFFSLHWVGPVVNQQNNRA